MEHLIKKFEPELSKYFVFNQDYCLPDDLMKEREDKFYHVYSTHLCNDNDKWVILKEMPLDQSEVYEKLSLEWNPYLETVFGVVKNEDGAIAISEFVNPPKSLNYDSIPKDKQAFVNQYHSLSLDQYIKCFGTLSEIDAVIFAYELCFAVVTMQNIGLTHKDIQPKNILLTNRLKGCLDFPKYTQLTNDVSVKLIDFDISRKRRFEEDTVTIAYGTTGFAAPEILSHADTQTVDIYAIGAVLQYMVTGKTITETNTKDAISQISGPLHKIILKATSASYENRYSISGFMRALYDFYEFQNMSMISRIICSLPGYRTSVFWKNFLASNIYLVILFIICISPWILANYTSLILLILALCINYDAFNLTIKLKYFRWLDLKYHKAILRIKRIVVFIMIAVVFFTIRGKI